MLNMYIDMDMELLDLSVALGTIMAQTAEYVQEKPTSEARKIDYSSGPEAFRRWGVTPEDCAGIYSNLAEFQCSLNMAIQGGLRSGLYYAGGLVGAGAGAAALCTGKDLIESGHWVLGAPLAFLGVGSGIAGAYSAGIAVQITDNAYEAEKRYCTCP